MVSWNLVLAVGRRPRLWSEGLRTLLAMAPRGWWRKPPFVPIPDADYAAWRVATARGDANARINEKELVSYLEWRQRQHAPLGRV
jgi:hypothetical protein